jgi:large subunit ribosomal protein L24
MDKIKKNDLVVVIAGKDKGKKGKVLAVARSQSRALVEAVNLIKRHQRRRSQDSPGGIIQKEAPLHISNLMLFCSHCNRPTRVGTTLLKDGTKTRFCKKCKEVL